MKFEFRAMVFAAFAALGWSASFAEADNTIIVNSLSAWGEVGMGTPLIDAHLPGGGVFGGVVYPIQFDSNGNLEPGTVSFAVHYNQFGFVDGANEFPGAVPAGWTVAQSISISGSAIVTANVFQVDLALSSTYNFAIAPSQSLPGSPTVVGTIGQTFGPPFWLPTQAGVQMTFAQPVRYSVTPTINPYAHAVTYGSYNSIQFGMQSDQPLVPTTSYSATATLVAQPLSPLKFFGAGVNWTNVGAAQVRGDLDATTFGNALTHLPNISGGIVPDTNLLTLDATAPGDTNLKLIQKRFQNWEVGLNPGDTAVMYFSSHSAQVTSLTTASVELNNDGNYSDSLTESAMADMLNHIPASVRVVVVVDACWAESYAGLATGNRQFLFASSVADDPTQYTPYDPVTGMGLYTMALDNAILAGNVDLTNLPHDLNYYLPPDLFGKTLPYKSTDGYSTVTGSALFTGLSSAVVTGSGFSGDLLGLPISVPEPSTALSLASGIAVIFLHRKRKP